MLLSAGRAVHNRMMYRIFLSHSSADADWVLWLADEIRKIGIFPYVFEQDPQPGRYVSEKIQEAIRASDAVVVFLTTNSHLAPYVQQEIGFAEGLNKLIIPLVQPGLDERMFAMLHGREYIPFDFTTPYAAVETLLNYLHDLRTQAESRLALFSFSALLLLALSSKR